MAQFMKLLSFGILIAVFNVGLCAMELPIKYRLQRLQFFLVLQVIAVTYISKKLIWKNLFLGPAMEAGIFHVNGSAVRIWRAGLISFLTLAHFSPFVYFIPVLISSEPQWIIMFAFGCLGVYILITALLISICSIEIAIDIIHRWTGIIIRKPMMLNMRTKALLVVIISTTTALYGFHNAVNPPVYTYVEIPTHKLPHSFDRIDIVHLSDLHLGPTVGKSMLNDVVNRIIAIDPAIVVITGDLVDEPTYVLKDALSTLSNLNPKYGSYFITGNHEYYTGDVENLMSELTDLGIITLHNGNKKITNPENDADWFCLAGTDDIQADKIGYTGHGMDIDQALSGCDSEHAIVLLAHQPNAATYALKSAHDISVILSGHTHGGQFFPWHIITYVASTHFKGLYRHGEHSYVYVTQGTFYNAIPMRTFSNPELTHISLRC